MRQSAAKTPAARRQDKAQTFPTPRAVARPCSAEPVFANAPAWNFAQVPVTSTTVHLQPKLTIGAVDHPLEREADAVADRVMRMPEASRTALQRKCTSCEKEDEAPVRRNATGVAPGTEPPIVGEVLRNQGQPLDSATREFMEPRFGHNFSTVRVHTGSQAAESAKSVSASAYTAGRDIVFGAGWFAPGTDRGRRLLAHELTHVVQQSGTSGSGATETEIRRFGDPTQAPAIDCAQAASSAGNVVTGVQFAVDSSALTPAAVAGIAGFIGSWTAAGADRRVRVDGFASVDGTQSSNWLLSCDRAKAVAAELAHPAVGTGVPAAFIVGPLANGETQEFGAAPNNRRATIAADLAVAPSVAPSPVPPGSPPAPTPSSGTAPTSCPTVPSSTPPTCGDRHTGYCDARGCFGANTWLNCVCATSAQICEAIEAFHFGGLNGALLEACVETEHHTQPFAIPFIKRDIREKGDWFRDVNSCIWGHWRTAVDALNNPAQPLPASVTPEWAAAIATCRSSGAARSACCRAQVEAEQKAIDRCSPYDSARFGTLPTDVPSSSGCSDIVASFAPGPPFTGDFGNVADRIAYGNARCCP